MTSEWIDDWKQIPVGQAFEIKGVPGMKYVRIDHLHPHGPALWVTPEGQWQMAFLSGPIKSQFRLTGETMRIELISADIAEAVPLTT